MVVPATPVGESNLVVVREMRSDTARREWVRIELGILPHASTGWVPRTALGALHTVRTCLVVDRKKRFRAVLWRPGSAVFRVPIGIGEPRWPSPARRVPTRGGAARRLR